MSQPWWFDFHTYKRSSWFSISLHSHGNIEKILYSTALFTGRKHDAFICTKSFIIPSTLCHFLANSPILIVLLCCTSNDPLQNTTKLFVLNNHDNFWLVSNIKNTTHMYTLPKPTDNVRNSNCHNSWLLVLIYLLHIHDCTTILTSFFALCLLKSLLLSTIWNISSQTLHDQYSFNYYYDYYSLFRPMMTTLTTFLQSQQKGG